MKDFLNEQKFVFIFTQNERICNVLADIECYRLPIHRQKEILVAMKRMQHAAVLRVGPLFPLNAETVSAVSSQFSFLHHSVHNCLATISADEENLFVSHVLDQFR